MTRKQRRGVLIGVGVAVLTLAAGLVLFALRDSIVFFHTPSDLAEKPIAAGQRFRLGGLVAAGSVKRGDGTKVEFVVTDTLKTVPVAYEGVLPDLFREGQGVVAEGKLTPEGTFVADSVLAKHDENYMPPEVAKALEAKGVKLGKGASHPERRDAVIVEIGHFALVLALARRHLPDGRAGLGRARARCAADGRGGPGGALPVRPARRRLPRADARLRDVGLLRRQRCHQLAFDEAAALSHLGRVGEPRRLDGAVGADPRAVRCRGRRFRAQPAADAEGQRAQRAGVDRGGVPALHPAHVQPVPAHRSAARRRQRPQSDPAGPGARLPSAVSLHGLCRLLDRLLVRHRGADRRAHRCRLGALGEAVDARRLDVPDASASPWARGGPTTSSAGAAGGSGIRSRTPRSCRGSPARRCCTRRSSWRSAMR